MKNKAYVYAEKVVSGEIKAPKQVRKICELFIHEFDVLQHQEGYEYFWNKQTEDDVMTILHLLNFARGAKSGESIGINLALWQYFLILNIFCWQHSKFPGKRKIREVIVTVSRKNSKSVIASLVHIIGFMLDEPNSKHYLASNKKTQAEIVFDETAAIISASPHIAPLFKVQKGYIEFLGKSGVGKLIALSGDSRRQDGIMPYIATIDECGADNNISKMIASITTGMKGPRNPLIIKISTSYGILNSYNYWQEVVDGLVKNTFADKPNPRKFGLAYVIDDPEEEIEVDGVKMERWEHQDNWLESNPLLAEIPDLWNELIEDYETSKNIPEDFQEFKIKNLNIWLPAIDVTYQSFMDIDTLQQYQMQELADWEWWRGKKQVFIGIDLAMSRDNTAVVFLWHDHTKGITYVKNKVYYPKAQEDYKVKSEKLRYDKWSQPKFDYCEAHEGPIVRWEKLAEDLHELIEEYEIGIASVLYDRKYAKDLIKYLEDNVFMETPAHDVDQNSWVLGQVISESQRQIYSGNVRYAPNPLFESAVTNGRVFYQSGKPYCKKPEHEKDGAKIDSLFALFNAFKGHMHYLDEELYDFDVDDLIL